MTLKNTQLKRVLLVIPVYASYRAFLKGLAGWLTERGWEVHVATNLTGVKVEADVATIYHIQIPRGANPYKLWKARRDLTTLIREIEPSVVHAHFSVGMLCLALAHRVKGVRTLGTFQGMRFPLASGIAKGIFKLVECFSILRLDQSWVLTADDYEAVPRWARNKLAIQEGYGFGCDIEHFDPALFSESDKSKLRLDLAVPDGDFVFVFVGRLTAFKGFLLALEAFQQLRAERDDVHFLVVGELDSQHPLDLPDLNLIEGVNHVGWQDDPAPYLAISDVMVFPSEREGMPVCVMEALAMGIPILTTDSRGCRELAGLSAAAVIEMCVDSILAALRAACRASTPAFNPIEVRKEVDRDRFFSLLHKSYSEMIR